MTTEQFKKKYSDLDLDDVKQFIEDYIEVIETEEPNATSTIARLNGALESLPSAMFDLW